MYMKYAKIIILLVIILNLIPFVFSDSVTVVANQGGNYQDGDMVSTNGASPSVDLKYLRLGDKLSGDYLFYIDFNTNTVPAGATIDEINLKLSLATYGPAADSINVTVLDIYSTSLSGETLADACTQGTKVAEQSTVFSAGTLNTPTNITLNALANTQLTDNLSDSFFSVCVINDNPLNDDQATFNSSESSLKPTLHVNYTLTDSTPSITLTHPTDASTKTSVPIDFNATVTDDQNITQCALWTNFTGVWAETDLQSNYDNSTDFNSSQSPSSGTYKWNVNCTDNNSQTSLATDNFTVTISEGTLTINITNLQNITVEKNSLFNITAEITCEGGYCGNVTSYLDPFIYKPSRLERFLNWLKGITGYVTGTAVSTIEGDTPFYTTTNPYNKTTHSCLQELSSDSCNVTWEVNATGSHNNYTFFANASNYIEYNNTKQFNVTIKIRPELNFTINNQNNLTVNELEQVNLSVSVGDNAVYSFYRNTTIYTGENTTNFTTNYYNFTVIIPGTEEFYGNNKSLFLTITQTLPTTTTIPTQSWSPNTNQSITISNYFSHVRDTLTYNSTTPDNMTVDYNNDNITLIPIANWTGTNYIVFNASDETNDTIESNNVTLTVTSGSGGTGGTTGGGGGDDDDDEDDEECSPSWICEGWSECNNEIQTRNCFDSNDCGTSKPDESRTCNECIPDWDCGSWSDCNGGEKTRVCDDGCGNTKTDTKECDFEIICKEKDCENIDELIDSVSKATSKVSITKNLTYNNETNSSLVSVKVEIKEDIKDFEYYQRIPKCMALLASLVKFKNTNYTVIEEDPLVVWQFAEVKKGTELDFSFEVLGKVSPDCYNLLKEVMYEEERFSPVNWTGALIGLLILSTVSFVVVKSASQSHKIKKIRVHTKVKSIKNKIKKL